MMEWRKFPYGWALMELPPSKHGNRAYAWIRNGGWMVRSYPDGSFPPPPDKDRLVPLPPNLTLDEAKAYVEVLQRMLSAP